MTAGIILTSPITLISILAFYLFSSPAAIEAQPQITIEVGKFSAATMGQKFPEGWKPLTFKKIEKHTTYTLVKDNDTVVVKAVSEASASGLTREIKIDPKEYPIDRKSVV